MSARPGTPIYRAVAVSSRQTFKVQRGLSCNSPHKPAARRVLRVLIKIERIRFRKIRYWLVGGVQSASRRRRFARRNLTTSNHLVLTACSPRSSAVMIIVRIGFLGCTLRAAANSSCVRICGSTVRDAPTTHIKHFGLLCLSSSSLRWHSGIVGGCAPCRNQAA